MNIFWLLIVAVLFTSGCKGEPPLKAASTEREKTAASVTKELPPKPEIERDASTAEEAVAPAPIPTEQQLLQSTLRGFLSETRKVLEREEAAPLVKVRHVLISWRQLSPAYKGKMDSRGAERSKEEANILATQLFQKLKEGASMTAMMKEHSEDPGSAAEGTTYSVTPTAGFVPQFKSVSLRLKVGEMALIESLYGWHLIKRAE